VEPKRVVLIVVAVATVLAGCGQASQEQSSKESRDGANQAGADPSMSLSGSAELVPDDSSPEGDAARMCATVTQADAFRDAIGEDVEVAYSLSVAPGGLTEEKARSQNSGCMLRVGEPYDWNGAPATEIIYVTTHWDVHRNESDWGEVKPMESYGPESFTFTSTYGEMKTSGMACTPIEEGPGSDYGSLSVAEVSRPGGNEPDPSHVDELAKLLCRPA
jgi:hypothetical protein